MSDLGYFLDLVCFRRSLVLVLGYACNHHCRYCIQGHEKPRSTGKTVSARTIELLNLAGEAASPGKLNITLYGGEPLLYEAALRELVTSVRHPALRWKMHTNGELLTPQLVDFFNAYGVHVGISHDGPNVLKTRGVDVFDNPKVCDLFRHLEEPSIEVVLTAHSQNLIQIREALCDRLNTDDWRLKPAFLVNAGKMPKDLLEFDFDAWNETVREVAERALRQFSEGEKSVRTWERRWVEYCLMDRLNPAPENPFIRFNERCLYPHVDLAGNISFCERLSAKLNELNWESGSVQQADSRFEAYSHQRHAACRNCEAFGWCRGQCPLESSAETPAMCRLMRIFASHMEPLARKLLDQGLYRPPMQYPNRRMLSQSLQGKRFIPIMQNCQKQKGVYPERNR